MASYDDTIMMRTKQKAMQNHIKKMQLLFEEADTSEEARSNFRVTRKSPGGSDDLAVVEMPGGSQLHSHH